MIKTWYVNDSLMWYDWPNWIVWWDVQFVYCLLFCVSGINRCFTFSLLTRAKLIISSSVKSQSTLEHLSCLKSVSRRKFSAVLKSFQMQIAQLKTVLREREIAAGIDRRESKKIEKCDSLPENYPCYFTELLKAGKRLKHLLPCRRKKLASGYGAYY